MSRSRHNWNQTLITIGTILPVVIVLGGLILSKSNSNAVTASTVADQDQEIKALQKEFVELELKQAAQSCKP
ncbi:MAG TPA: hypothetical protein VJP80_01155 [Candidatus Saccharimonadales bacterium]|nr:hypothetical protein [Candidatus Saccharimonadales bacterium]